MADALEEMLEVSLAEVSNIHDAELTGWHSGNGLFAHKEVAVRVQFAETIARTKDILQTSLENGGVGFEKKERLTPNPSLEERGTITKCFICFFADR